MALEPSVVHRMRGQSADVELAQLAERQHGVVSRAQLLALGFHRRSIDRNLARARLHRVHRGVYAVGHRRLSHLGVWTAAVLAAGPRAVLSHRSAAELWAIAHRAGSSAVVTAPTRRRPIRVEVHESILRYDEVTEVEGFPVTTVSRTLLDLAAVESPHRLERALREAEARRLGDPASLAVLLDRHPRRRGTRTLRVLLAARRASDGVTRSELEERFLAFLDDSGLPRPRLNARVEARGRLLECDCTWRAHRLVVELDGQATHSSTEAFERDRARDRALHAEGWRVVRVTWRQLHRETESVAADLESVLGAGSSPRHRSFRGRG